MTEPFYILGKPYYDEDGTASLLVLKVTPELLAQLLAKRAAYTELSTCFSTLRALRFEECAASWFVRPDLDSIITQQMTRAAAGVAPAEDDHEETPLEELERVDQGDACFVHEHEMVGLRLQLGDLKDLDYISGHMHVSEQWVEFAMDEDDRHRSYEHTFSVSWKELEQPPLSVLATDDISP